MSEFEQRRWEAKTKPSDHKPVEALRAALRAIENGELDPSHVIVVYCGKEDERSRVGYYQAGDIDGWLGSLGLLTRAAQIMGNG